MAIDGRKALVMVGEERNEYWPDAVPSFPHPLVLRLEPDVDRDGRARTIVAFEHAVTGYERFGLDDRFLEGLEAGKRMYPCAGGMGWPSLSVDGGELRAAIEALRSEGPCVWRAHARVLDGKGGTSDVVLEETASFPAEGASVKEADRAFEKKIGVDPDRDLLKAMFAKGPKAHVGEVLLQPESWPERRHWLALAALSEAGKEASNQAAQSLRAKRDGLLDEASAKNKTLPIEGVASEDFTRIGRGDSAGVKGILRTREGLDFNVVAFGVPAKELAWAKRGDPIRALGSVRGEGLSREVRLISAQRMPKERDLRAEAER